MIQSKDARYTAAKRVYGKAHKAIEGAIARICRTEDKTFDEEQSSFLAVQMLELAGRQVNDELRGVEAVVGVGVYQPYGGKGRR